MSRSLRYAWVTQEKLSKRSRLRRAGILHPHPERVRDSLFVDHPDFFDSSDLVQVRYELLRAHLLGRQKVARLCHRFGVSRQTFYSLLERFRTQGSGGLLPGRPGPRGPWKLSGEVVSFVRRRLASDDQLSGAVLVPKLEARFGVSLHKRTIEKLLKELRGKKNG